MSVFLKNSGDLTVMIAKVNKKLDSQVSLVMTDKEMLIKGQKSHLAPCMPLARPSAIGATTKPLKPCNKC